MNKRIIWILAGLLALQLTLAVILGRPRQAASLAAPLFPDLTADQVVGLTIADSGGNTVQLARQGDNWVLPAADDYPADDARVAAALTKLLAVTTSAPVTETAASHARLQVADDDFMRRVELQLAAGDALSFILGASPGAGASYVRRPGEEAVYQAQGLTAWEWSSAPSGWVDTLYLDVPQEQLAALTLTNAQGELRLTRRDDGGWALANAPEGYALDDTAVNTLVQRAATVRLTAPLGKALLPAYGLEAPLATITLTSDAGEQTLRVGAVQADGNYAVKWSTADYVVSVAPYAAQGLIEASVVSLQQKAQPAAQ